MRRLCQADQAERGHLVLQRVDLAEHLRQNLRLTVDEAKLIDLAWEMHSGDSEPVVRHYLASKKSVRLEGYGLFGRTFGDTSNWSRSRAAASTSSTAA